MANTELHPAIYRQPSEVRPGDPREPHILVGSWATGWRDLRRARFDAAMDRIAPRICALSQNGGDG